MAVDLRTNGLRVKGSPGGVTSTTIAAPAGLVAGDFLLLIGGSDTDTAQAGFVGPDSGDGFTALTPWGGTLGGANVKLWTRWATSSDVGKTYTLTLPTGSSQVLYLAALTGVDTSSPIALAPVHADGGSVTATALVAPSLTPDVAAFALFAWWSKGGSAAQTITAPSPSTGLSSSSSSGTDSTGYTKSALAREDLAAGVASGTRTATLSGTARRWSAVSLALRPAVTSTPAPSPRSYPLGQAVETDSALAISRRRTRALGQAGEVDQVRPVNRLPGEVRKAVETDQLPSITRVRTTRVGEPTETDRALAISRLRTRRLGQAGETNIVQPIKRLRLTRIGQAVEYDVLRQIDESSTSVSDAAYDRAISARDRRAYATLRVDWTNLGVFPNAVTDPGYLDDVLGEVEIERALDGDLPEGAGQIDGFATATLTAELGGTRKGASMPFAAELSPFRPDSPLYGVAHKVLSQVAAEIGLVTEEGPRAERLFTGSVRDLDMSEGESSVHLEGADPSERLRALVTLPTYGEFVTHANRRKWKLTVNTQAVVDFCLRACGIFASPPARPESIISCTGHGGLFAEKGFNGAPISIYGSGPAAGLWTYGEHPYGMLGTPESPNAGTVGYQEFYGITDGVAAPVRFESGNGVGFSCLLHAGSYMSAGASVENRLVQIRVCEREYPRLFVNVFGNGDLYAGLATDANTIVGTPRIPTGAGPWRFLGVHWQWTSNTTLVVRVRLDGTLRTYTLNVPAVSLPETAFFGGYRPILQANAGLSRSWSNLQVWPSYAAPTTTSATPWRGETHTSQADVGRGNNELIFLPDVSSADAWDVLKAAVSAEYGVHGFTEYGRYYFRPRTDVRPDRVDHVLDVASNLAEVGYKLSSDTIRNAVGVTTSKSYHSGSLKTVVKAEDVEQFVCPVGTTTFELDWPHGAAGYQGGILPYHQQKDTETPQGFPEWSGDVVHGWTYSTRGASGNWTILDNTRSVVVRYVQVSSRRVQIRVANPGPGSIRLATAMPADASSEGEPAMRIGGWPLEKAVDKVSTYRNAASIAALGGVAGGGERALPIPSSEWRQDETALSPVAYALLEALADERPLLEDLPVRGDPRIRVGNVAECHFRDLSVPVTGTVVKTRHRLSGEEGLLETLVSVRPLPTSQLNPAGVTFFVDVSHYQAETSTPLELARLKVLGYGGVIAKIGQGAGTKANGDTLGAISDAAWAKWRDEGLALWPRSTAGYWYVGNTESPAAQAARCLALIGDASIPVMLDWEDGGGSFANLLACLDAFRAAGLLVTMVYAGRGYAGSNAPTGSTLAGRGVALISARYWTNDPAGVDPRADFDSQRAGFGFEPFLGLTPRANQFTQYGVVYAGQKIDVDAFRGSPTELAAMFNGE